MGSLIQGLRRLYSLDTLDTRLTTSSTTPIKTAVADSTRDPTAGKDARAQEIASRAQPSKWNTPEFYFYYFVFLTVVPMMFKTVMDVSQPDHPAYANYVDLLSPGWIPGRKVVRSLALPSITSTNCVSVRTTRTLNTPASVITSPTFSYS